MVLSRLPKPPDFSKKRPKVSEVSAKAPPSLPPTPRRQRKKSDKCDVCKKELAWSTLYKEKFWTLFHSNAKYVCFDCYLDHIEEGCIEGCSEHGRLWEQFRAVLLRGRKVGLAEKNKMNQNDEWDN